MKAFICALAVTAAATWAAAAGKSDFRPSDWVNPFIGASTSVGEAGVYHGLGKTFPGATTPFGMVQLSPTPSRAATTVPATATSIQPSRALRSPK